jgi:hypothetical protein
MICFKIRLFCGFSANSHRCFSVNSASSPISLAAVDITLNRLRCVLFDITRATAHRLPSRACTPSTPASRHPINARIHRCSQPQAPSGRETHGSNTPSCGVQFTDDIASAPAQGARRPFIAIMCNVQGASSSGGGRCCAAACSYRPRRLGAAAQKRQQLMPLCPRATCGEFLHMRVKHSRLHHCACDASVHLMATGTLAGSSRGCVASPSEASLKAAHVFLHHGIRAPVAWLPC